MGERQAGDRSFDFVVVGAVSSGCLVASRLNENSRHSVALLEAGPKDTSLWVHLPRQDDVGSCRELEILHRARTEYGRPQNLLAARPLARRVQFDQRLDRALVIDGRGDTLAARQPLTLGVAPAE